MIPLFNYHGFLKGIVEPFLNRSISLSVRFENEAPPSPEERAKAVRARKPKVYHLHGEGAFGGMVLQAALALKGQGDLFENVQVDKHSADTSKPERAKGFKRMIRTGKFANQEEAGKDEANLNK
jgi:hypothetical protein